jgi:mRNA interferase RelE/StbE
MSDETAELVRALHPDIKRKIKAALQAILNDPKTGKGLRDELEGLQNFKVGKFRVIYKTATDRGIIEIVAIGPRKTIYEETLRLLKREK